MCASHSIYKSNLLHTVLIYLYIYMLGQVCHEARTLTLTSLRRAACPIRRWLRSSSLWMHLEEHVQLIRLRCWFFFVKDYKIICKNIRCWSRITALLRWNACDPYAGGATIRSRMTRWWSLWQWWESWGIVSCNRNSLN